MGRVYPVGLDYAKEQLMVPEVIEVDTGQDEVEYIRSVCEKYVEGSDTVVLTVILKSGVRLAGRLGNVGQLGLGLQKANSPETWVVVLYSQIAAFGQGVRSFDSSVVSW